MPAPPQVAPPRFSSRDSKFFSMGGSSGKLLRIEAPDADEPLRVLQWNILADGLSDDGFLVRSDNVSPDTDQGIRDQVERVLKIKKEGTPADMEALRQELATDEAKELHADVVRWSRRWEEIKKTIIEHDPHILTLQEVDKMKQMEKELGELGYDCGLPGRSYKPAHEVLALNVKGSASSTVNEYFRHLAEVGVAFAPKTKSNARNFALKRKVADADDDGVAIFWKRDRFTASSIDFLAMDDDKRNQGAVCVELLGAGGTIYSAERLTVIAAHLTSGDKEADEISRMKEVIEPSLDANGAASAPSLREWFDEASKRGPTLLCLDANTYPDRPGLQTGWKALRSIPGAQCVWDDYFAPHGAPLPHSGTLPVTSNKMRGPLSDQPKKIGEHAYHLVDHIFFNRWLSFERHLFEPLVYKSVEDAWTRLLPSFAIPSDHAPLIVELSMAKHGSRDEPFSIGRSRSSGRLWSSAKSKSRSMSRQSVDQKTKELDEQGAAPNYMLDHRMDPVNVVAFSDDGSLLASGMRSTEMIDGKKTEVGRLRVHSIMSKEGKQDAIELLWPPPTPQPVTCLAFSAKLKGVSVLAVGMGARKQSKKEKKTPPSTGFGSKKDAKVDFNQAHEWQEKEAADSKHETELTPVEEVVPLETNDTVPDSLPTPPPSPPEESQSQAKSKPPSSTGGIAFYAVYHPQEDSGMEQFVEQEDKLDVDEAIFCVAWQPQQQGEAQTVAFGCDSGQVQHANVTVSLRASTIELPKLSKAEEKALSLEDKTVREKLKKQKEAESMAARKNVSLPERSRDPERILCAHSSILMTVLLPLIAGG
jgi:hypothetical protein